MRNYRSCRHSVVGRENKEYVYQITDVSTSPPREAKRQLEQRKQNLHGQKEELEQKTKKLQVRHDPNTKTVCTNVC